MHTYLSKNHTTSAQLSRSLSVRAWLSWPQCCETKHTGRLSVYIPSSLWRRWSEGHFLLLKILLVIIAWVIKCSDTSSCTDSCTYTHVMCMWTITGYLYMCFLCVCTARVRVWAFQLLQSHPTPAHFSPSKGPPRGPSEGNRFKAPCGRDTEDLLARKRQGDEKTGFPFILRSLVSCLWILSKVFSIIKYDLNSFNF